MKKTTSIGIFMLLTIGFGLFNAPAVDGRHRSGLRAIAYDSADADGGTEPWTGFTGTQCASMVVPNIDYVWGGDSVLSADCGGDDVFVHFTGFINPPRSARYTFYTSTDDGFRVLINRRIVIDDWNLQGNSLYNAEGTIRLGARRYAIDVWYFEHSGGAAARLYYSTRSGEPEIVPSSWFSER